MRKRSLGALSLLLVLLFLFSACSSQAPASPAAPTAAPAAKPTAAPASAAPQAAPTAAPAAPAAAPTAAAKKPTGTVTVGLGDLECKCGSSRDVSGTYGNVVLSNVQETLLFIGPDSKIKPGLAKSWEMSKDGKKVTWKLQQGVQWHGGYGEFTSADVKFNIEYIGDESAKNHMGPYIRQYIESVETPDKYTVVFNMKKTSFDVFERFSNRLPYFLLGSKAHYDKVGSKGMSDQWIGTGPWQLVEYSDGNFAKFKAVENHWRHTPDFEFLVIKAIPDAATRVMMLRSGDIDASDVPLQSVPDIEKDGLKVVTSAGFPFWMLFGNQYLPTRETFRKDIPWSADPADKAAWEKALKVRKAMAMAVDTKLILETILHGKGILTAVPGMLPTHPGYDPNWKQYPYDPDGAKKLLTDAGYPNGFSATMSLYSLPGRDELQDVGIAQSAMFEKIGIKVQQQKVDYTAVFSPAHVARKQYGLYNYAYSLPEAISFWDQNGKSSIQKNWFGENETLDKMISAGMSKLDAEERAQATREIGQWFIDNVWGIPIASKDTPFGYNPKKLGGWQLVPLFAYPNQFEYLKKAQ